MPKHGSRGFRWADLAMEHQKAISHYTASTGRFPQYMPCQTQTDTYLSCLEGADFSAIECAKEKMALTACIDTSPMVSPPSLLRSAATWHLWLPEQREPMYYLLFQPLE